MTQRGKKKVTLIVEQEGSSNQKRMVYSSRKINWMFGLGILGLAALIVSSIIVFGEWHVRLRTGQLIAENRLLGHQLADIQKRLNVVQYTVDSMAVEEDQIRVRVDLPPLGEDVRKAGIGSLLPLEGQMIGDERVEELLLTLDQIEREVSVQRQSFTEIQRKIVNDEDRLAHIPAVIPVHGARLTDAFGYRPDPFTKARRFHYGADFSSPRGTPIYATADGKVVEVKRAARIGKMIKIDHGYGFLTMYGHLEGYNVRKGEKVQRGDVIGYVGNTGRSTAPHLHYEVRLEGRSVDPLDYFYEGFELAERY